MTHAHANIEPGSRILIGGDFCPVGRALPLVLSGRRDAWVRDLDPVLDAADLVVVNLECPFVTGPAGQSLLPGGWNALTAPRDAVAGLEALGVHGVTLANNHLRDGGDEGVRTTLATCEEHGIATFGGGLTREEALRIRVLQAGDRRIGWLGLSQREFSIATSTRPGAAPLDPWELPTRIAESRADWDHLIVLLHAGVEHHPFPSPALRAICRALLRWGASAVICQHSHCAGIWEESEEGLIVYGQGNLLFDWVPNPGPRWNEGYLVELCFDVAGAMTHRLIGTMQGGDTPGLRAMTTTESEVLFSRLRALGDAVREPGALEAQWRRYCTEMREEYLALLRGRTGADRWRAKVARRTGLAWTPFTEEQMRVIGNVLRCEGHREVLDTLFSDFEDLPTR